MKGTWQTTDGGGGGLVVVIVAAVLIGSGAAPAIASAAVTIAIIVACLAAAAVLGGAALVVYRARKDRLERSGRSFQQARSELRRSDRPGRDIEAPPIASIPPRSRPQLEESHKPAIGPGREIHLHLNVTPGQLAAIMRHYTEEE